MLNQINTYLIVGLLALVLALGGGWYLNRSWDAATIDTLKADKIRLTDAVEQNEKTISQMIIDAQVLAASNQKLTSRIVAAEMQHVEAWKAIDALSLESTGDTAELEARANDAFGDSINALRVATGR